MKLVRDCLLKISVLCLIITFSNSCSSTRINTEAPEKVSVAPKYERRLSNINIPLSLGAKQLEEMANRELGIILYKDDNPDDDHFAITVSRTGPVIINAENDQLIYTVPIHVYALAKYEVDVCKVCPRIGKSKSTEFDIRVRCKTTLSLTADWQVASHTVSDFEWGNKPYVELGPISIPISRIVEPIVKKQIDNVSGILDKEIQKKVEIRSKVQKAWNDIQQPILLDKAHEAWLKISPRELRSSYIHCVNDQISIRIGIRSYIETFTGAKPAADIDTKLPGLILDDKLADDFKLVLSGDVPYDYASKYIKDEFVGKFYEFENGKYLINVKDAELYGSPEHITLRLSITGKAGAGLFSKNIKGDIYLQGTPYYDPHTFAVRVRDFDFHFKTKSVLLKTASWVTRIGFRQKIQESLQVPVKDKLDEARKMVQDGINKNGRLNNSVMLKGNITDITPEGIYLSPTSIKAVVTGSGNVSILIDKL